MKIFSRVENKTPKSSLFDLGHDVKMSGEIGVLYPVLAMDCVPGDYVSLSCQQSMVRFAPLLAPIMHRVDVYVHYWFVPNRLVWDGWEGFITNENPSAMPYITHNDVSSPAVQKFLDYFGVGPMNAGKSVDLCALPFAAYQCIYNECYRDQNLIQPVPQALASGSNAAPLFCQLRNRAWEHDYFTSCLPFAQKGNAVDIPLGDVVLKDDYPLWPGGGPYPHFVDQNGANLPAPGNTETLTVNSNGAGTISDIEIPVGGDQAAYDPEGTLEVEPTTITDLRRAFKLQEWFEKLARGGSRYTEQIKAFFGVRSQDMRLQRPEYITGVKSPVVVSEVLNTTGTTSAPQGDMAGHGVAVTGAYGGGYAVKEHGYIIAVMSVMPKTAYQDGVPKHLLRNDFLDFYWPQFAHIGEQAVLNVEVQRNHTTQNGTFGYIPRYAEYKYMPSRVAGDFRTSFDFWHMGRQLPTGVSLNGDFITCTATDVDRVFAVASGVDHLWCQIIHSIKARRPMPYFGSPTI